MRQKQGVFSLFLLSLSSRRAWIEIPASCWRNDNFCKSLSSRRAWIEIIHGAYGKRGGAAVALLAEGVDRNPQDDVSPFHDGRSLSSRRAWIEIVFGLQPPQPHPGVALLAEGVDRNLIIVFS